MIKHVPQFMFLGPKASEVDCQNSQLLFSFDCFCAMEKGVRDGRNAANSTNLVLGVFRSWECQTFLLIGEKV